METKEFYKTRLQLVVSYIRDNYNKAITIADLEEATNYSYRNLQRIFKGYYKETIGAYITRIKVENGARLLKFSSEEIKLIAEKVGYADVQSFSKAFKKHFGIAPASFRAHKKEIFSKSQENKNSMPFFEDRIENLQAKKVVYKRIKADYYSNEIDKVWDNLLQEMKSKIDVDKAESFGIIWDEPLLSEQITFDYDACLVIENDINIQDKKFKIKTIPNQKYAVFTHFGSYKSIGSMYDKIFNNWIFNTKNEVSEMPFLEFYRKHESHTTNKNEYETEIYVPLKH